MFDLFTQNPLWILPTLLLVSLLGGLLWRFRKHDQLRAWPLLALFLATIFAVLMLNQQKAGLTLFGVSKLALGGYLGYWCDRLGFRPEDRPHRLEGISKGTAWKRRAIIIAAAIVAAALIP